MRPVQIARPGRQSENEHVVTALVYARRPELIEAATALLTDRNERIQNDLDHIPSMDPKVPVLGMGHGFAERPTWRSCRAPRWGGGETGARQPHALTTNGGIDYVARPAEAAPMTDPAGSPAGLAFEAGASTPKRKRGIMSGSFHTDARTGRRS